MGNALRESSAWPLEGAQEMPAVIIIMCIYAQKSYSLHINLHYNVIYSINSTLLRGNGS